MEERRGEAVGVRQEEFGFCGKKSAFSPHMALSDGDKYNQLNGAVIERACRKMQRASVRSSETHICLVSAAISADLFLLNSQKDPGFCKPSGKMLELLAWWVSHSLPFVFLPSPMAAFQVSGVSFPCNLSSMRISEHEHKILTEDVYVTNICR